MPKVKKTTKIGRTVLDTKIRIDKIQKLHPENAPNVVYILMDDMGFAHLGCYGSNINTPNIDRLAEKGLRYNNFHTTAICSATRASLLTGANHHTVGVASVVEMVTGCDNATGHISNSYGTVAEILKEYDYATYCTGKWHLTTDRTESGPYDQWPIQRGFDRYYGFLYAHDDQYHPHLVQDNSYIQQPKTVDEGYHFSEDIVDHAIDLVYQHTLSSPEQPFFLYLPFGAMHAPHHAPKEYIDRYKGKFDKGWDEIRKEWYEKQKEIGIIPQDAELTDRNEYVQAWYDLNDKQKAVYARHMEAFAGLLEYTDEQIGRFVKYLEDSNKLDNTVIVFLLDNGASAEGGVNGRFNGWSGLNFTADQDYELNYAYEHLDEIGSETSFPHYPTGWANAGNTPFQWYKIWTHEGGVRDPLIISYPNGIKDKGGIRSQYHHVSDITPTILDIIGIEKPDIIKGVAQKPFTGISMAYTFDNKDADDERTVQYYEIFGNRSIYKDGWKAVTNHTLSKSYKDDVWELYHVAEDFTEKYNVADEYPEKLRELQDEFLIEAARNNVFPMLRNSFHESDIGLLTQYGTKYTIPNKKIVFNNVIKPYDLVSKQLVSGSNDHSVEVEINRTSKEDEGVLYSFGDRFGGAVLYIKGNKLKYGYNDNKYKYYYVVSITDVPVGKSVVKYRFKKDGIYSGDVEIFINKQLVGKEHIDRIFYGSSSNATLKANHYTPVVDDYEVPFEFTGKIDKVTIHQYETELDYKEELEKIAHIE